MLLAALPAPASAQTAPSHWVEQVRALLERRARAVRAGDEAAFRDTMRDAPPAYVRDRVRWLRGLRALPFDDYTLELDAADGYLDLAAGSRHAIEADEIHVVPVTERFTLRGFDDVPASDTSMLTIVRRGERWTIHGDDALQPLGLLSARAVWDFAPVEQVRAGPVLVLTQGSRAIARRIARETASAVRFVAERWPLSWKQRVVVVIPRSSRVLGRVLRTTFDLGPFVAFASSSVEREDGAVVFGGHRVYVQPETFFDYSESFQADTLSHELLHIATRDRTGAFVPSWLEEGVAQVFGERSAPALGALVDAEASGAFDGSLPQDWEFTVGERRDIHLAYARSADFVDHLRDRFGARKVARFYDRLGGVSPVAFGTSRYHLDRSARAAFGRSFGSLRAAWASSVRKRF